MPDRVLWELPGRGGYWQVGMELGVPAGKEGFGRVGKELVVPAGRKDLEFGSGRGLEDPADTGGCIPAGMGHRLLADRGY